MASSHFSYMDVTAHQLVENFGTHSKCLAVHLAVHLAPGSYTTDFI